MAKQGYSISQRRKVEVISAAGDVDIKVHDCGTTFVIGQVGARTITLPTSKSAGSGWWCRIVMGVSATGDQTVDLAGDEEFAGVIRVAGDGAAAAITHPAATHVLFDVSGADGGNGDVGDCVEIMQLGGSWYAWTVSAI